METILLLLFIFFGGAIFRMFFAGLGAAGRTIVGDGSLSENWNRSMGNFGPFTVRLIDKTVENIDLKMLEIKGMIPTSGGSLDLRVMLRDITDGQENSSPVITLIEHQQLPDNKTFFMNVNLGVIEHGMGIHKWVEMLRIVPMFLIPPHTGKRRIQLVSAIYDHNNEAIWGNTDTYFELDFSGTGYLEQSENDKKARSLTIQLSVAVALADGQLDTSEIDIINKWILKTINVFDDEETKAELGELYQKSYDNAVNPDNNITLSFVTKEMNEYADDNIKYQALSLCYDVMTADGEIATEELNIIKNLSKALNLDYLEVERMRDKKMVDFDTSQISKESIEDILGIDENTSEDQKRKLLREEFKKWNDRLTSLDEGPERDNAQEMINLISEAIQKYK